MKQPTPTSLWTTNIHTCVPASRHFLCRLTLELDAVHTPFDCIIFDVCHDHEYLLHDLRIDMVSDGVILLKANNSTAFFPSADFLFSFSSLLAGISGFANSYIYSVLQFQWTPLSISTVCLDLFLLFHSAYMCFKHRIIPSLPYFGSISFHLYFIQTDTLVLTYRRLGLAYISVFYTFSFRPSGCFCSLFCALGPINFYIVIVILSPAYFVFSEMSLWHCLTLVLRIFEELAGNSNFLSSWKQSFLHIGHGMPSMLPSDTTYLECCARLGPNLTYTS